MVMKYNIALFVFCLMLFGLAAHAAHAASLRTQSIVTDDVIRLGDLFNGLQHSHDHVLGAAPRPGEDMVLNAQTLLRVAMAMNLDWRPGNSGDHLVIKRAATIVDADMVEATLRDALYQRGVTGDYNILFQASNPQLVLPPDMPPSVEISGLRYDANNGWFEADAFAPSASNPQTQIRLTGRTETLTQVPVLRDTLRAGSSIGANDIEMSNVPAQSLSHDVVLDPQELIGKTPRRMVVAGKPIKFRDVEQPRVVSRGDTVTMIYQNGSLRLTAMGKAMENGSRGDLIRVVNGQSNRSVEAVVTGQQEVTVKF